MAAVATAIVLTIAVTACSGGEPAPTKTVVIVETPAPADPPATKAATTKKPAAAKPAPKKSAEAEETFTMPKVMGMVLQDAQDELQSLDSYLMDQEDAMGWGRLQLLDANWKVCTQKPSPGKKVPISTVVKLASVKLSEDCP
ncbi:hypothetical protein [Luteimicrobium sp. DT211]|uniref:hypothetical protein n=1 Tax=Luteimicrobium sp. DT211 TaxID=3393412 RepID=UPI003CF13C72